MDANTSLLLVAALGVLGLIVLVAVCKLHAFLALVLTSLFVGAMSGMSLPAVAKAFQDGIGGSLASIAAIVGLGTMLGRLLGESGGAEVVANTFIRALGRERLQVAMAIGAFIVGLPVFFGVGVLLLAPVLFTIARETRLPLLTLALPMIAGLSASHCLVPPHVGPMVAIEKLKADVGGSILYSLGIGFVAAVVVGVFYTRFITRSVSVTPGGLAQQLAQPHPSRTRTPGFGLTLFTIALPVLLMLADTVAKLTLPADPALRDAALQHPVRQFAAFVGSPVVSMFLAVLFGLESFGRRCGFNRAQLLKFTEDCLGPTASILLIVGAGGGFSKVLDQAGVAGALATSAVHLQLSPLLLGWVLAVLIRVAVGSATVTVTMTAGMLAPIADATPGTNRELLVVALGAGSMIASHVNDGGFWFVKEYLNMTVAQTLKTWTVLSTLLSIVAIVVTLLLDRLL